MKRYWPVIAVVLLTTIAVTPLWAQQAKKGNLKVGYVELNAVLQEFEPYQKAMKKLDRFRKDIQSRIDKSRSQIDRLRKDLRDSKYLSAQKRQKKRKKLRRKMRSFQQSRRRSQKMMQRKKKQLLKPVRDRVQKAVKITAEELGYDVVHRFGGRGPSTVLWVSPDVNMTDEVIKRLSKVKPDKDDSSSSK